MVVLGLILLIIGLVANIPILTTIGIILVIVGLILNFVPIGGTRRRFTSSRSTRPRPRAGGCAFRGCLPQSSPATGGTSRGRASTSPTQRRPARAWRCRGTRPRRGQLPDGVLALPEGLQ